MTQQLRFQGHPLNLICLYTIANFISVGFSGGFKLQLL